MRNRHDIVGRAFVHLGHRETAENDSVLIRAWLRRCGVFVPSAWCAAFASWCLEDDKPSAGALNLARNYLETREPQPGDLMFFATDDQGHGHIGIVVGVAPAEALCIEGNSANMVRLVRRLRREVRFASTRPGELAGPETVLLEPWPTAPLVRVSKEGTR